MRYRTASTYNDYRTLNTLIVSKVAMTEQFASQREECLKTISNFKSRKINRRLCLREVSAGDILSKFAKRF